MKYPYIGKHVNTFGDFSIAVLTRESFGALLENNIDHKPLYVFMGGFNEGCFKNITPEFLANTYGEVKSKEHAEFIVKLAEVAKCAGLEVAKHKIANAESFKGIFFNFYNDNGSLWFAFHHESQAKNRGEKQITIPLPPECESVDEWPCVNDEVLTSDGVGTVKLLPDSKGYYIVSVGGEYYQYQLYELEKPKTPEQELREFLHLLWCENNEDFDDFADIAILHLKKKGEGDE